VVECLTSKRQAEFKCQYCQKKLKGFKTKQKPSFPRAPSELKLSLNESFLGLKDCSSGKQMAVYFPFIYSLYSLTLAPIFLTSKKEIHTCSKLLKEATKGVYSY
jgi:hypothetical protein